MLNKEKKTYTNKSDRTDRTDRTEVDFQRLILSLDRTDC